MEKYPIFDLFDQNWYQFALVGQDPILDEESNATPETFCAIFL